ncbi:MAG: amidohydrolase family protein, partial [Steroidobacter sp.]
MKEQNKNTFQFVDAHIHLWELQRISYPWLMPPFSDDGPNGSVEPIAHDYTLDDYFDDAREFNLVKAVHIDAGAHPSEAIRETRWLQELADKTGFPHAIVGFAALNDPDVAETLAQHVESRNVRGIRHIINWHPDPKRTYMPRNLLDDPAFARGYALLKKYNLSFDLQIYPNQMQGAYELIEQHPQTQVIINHMGMPVDADKSQWMNGLKMLSALPHVAVKISGFGFIKRQWTLNDVKPLVEQVIECFDMNRVMFASDFPTDKLFNTFAQS